MAEPSVGTIAPGVNATLPGEVKNQTYWTISGIHSSSVQVLTVTTTITGVSAPQYLLNARTGEIIYAEGISGATFTSCARGADGTTAIAMANGDRIYLVNSANIYNQLRREILRIDSYLVTNGDTHDHSGGDGAQISHAGLSDLTTGDPHTQYQKESEKGAVSGYASLNASTKVVEDPANATATPTASKIPIADGSGKLDGWISTTSDSVSGLVELATTAETTTGTDTARAVTPDGLSGSDYGKRIVEWRVIASGTALTTGDGKDYFVVPVTLNGYNLVDFDIAVDTVSSSGTPTVQLYNVTDSQDILSTVATIDANEFTSYTAATAPAINTSYDDVSTGDRLRCDVDVSGTGTTGLILIMIFQLP
jgi:hypothetical protein